MMKYNSMQGSASPDFLEAPRTSPYLFDGSHGDVFAALTARDAVARNAQRDQQLTAFENDRLGAQREAAMRGIQNLQQARQQQMDVANRQQGMRFGLVNSLLSGLFR